jgi:hypothetical protein
LPILTGAILDTFNNLKLKHMSETPYRAPNKLPEHKRSVKWILDLFKEMGTGATLVTRDNYQRLEMENKNTWEVDEDNEGLHHAKNGDCIIPDEPPKLKILNRTYEVIDAHCSAEYAWCNWSFGIVDVENRIWHSLDARILKETPYETA